MEKNKKHGIIIGISSLLLVTLILLGLTYAYYKTRIVGNTNEKSVSVESKKYEVTYTDGDATLSTEGKIEPGFTYTKEFTVTNTGNESVKYSIILDNIENTFTRDQDWKYTLTKGETEIAKGTIAVGTHQVLIGSETLESGSQTYKLTVTYINSTEDQSVDMGQKMSFRVNISDETQTWENAGEGTLLYAIKNSKKTVDGEEVSMIVETPTSIPGRVATTESEAEIASTQDDYGTSYYYRGNVTNNYVNYSGMCWRIVRVQGDGTIKLALADENGECNASTYSTDNTTSAFVNNGTGYTYKSSASYNATDFPFATSDIPEVLNSWKASKNLDTSKLVDAEWCNDTANTSKTFYNSNWEMIDGSDSSLIAYTYLYYGAYDRLYPVSTANPTLKCNIKGVSGSTGTEANAQRYKNVLGILSADEVAFAGDGGYLPSGDYNYLETNARGNTYWTMSPYNMVTTVYSGVWVVSSITGLNTYGIIGDFESVRPAIVLASNVTISSGDGTNANPYVIN